MAEQQRGLERPAIGMEMLMFFLKGVGAGFVVAAPVGPVAALCVRRTLARSAVSGYATGLGAAVADTFYGVLAAFGVSAIADLLVANEHWFRVIGGMVLCALAIRTFFAGPAEARSKGPDSLTGDFLSALVITGTNPITIIAFGVIFTSIGIATAGEDIEWAGALVAGVFVGSLLWWATLTGIAGLFRAAVSHAGLRWINRISGAVILASGVIVLISAMAPASPLAQLVELPFG
jgi:threonine/homoserine/homoserine lactone efflux protein